MYRIGQVVPNSNVTMEIEVPKMFRAREQKLPEQFSFHSARVRLTNVSPEELSAMNKNAFKAIDELLDMSPDVIAYACLVAVMAEGKSYHQVIEKKINDYIHDKGGKATFVSSAGSLINCLHLLKAKKVSLICPYSDKLTQTVLDYIEAEGVKVSDYRNLSVINNEKVGILDETQLLKYAKTINMDNSDCLIVSACVQMPSLSILQAAEYAIMKPVISASSATTYQICRSLKIPPIIPNAGIILSGKH